MARKGLGYKDDFCNRVSVHRERALTTHDVPTNTLTRGDDGGMLAWSYDIGIYEIACLGCHHCQAIDSLEVKWFFRVREEWMATLLVDDLRRSFPRNMGVDFIKRSCRDHENASLFDRRQTWVSGVRLAHASDGVELARSCYPNEVLAQFFGLAVLSEQRWRGVLRSNDADSPCDSNVSVTRVHRALVDAAAVEQQPEEHADCEPRHALPDESAKVEPDWSKREQTMGDVLFDYKQLAREFDLPAERLRGRLRRWQNRNKDQCGTGFMENPDAISTQTKYSYRFAAILPVIRDFYRDQHPSSTSASDSASKRPA